MSVKGLFVYNNQLFFELGIIGQFVFFQKKQIEKTWARTVFCICDFARVFCLAYL